MDRQAFARLVRDALGHLYDHEHLQRHPLAQLLATDATPEMGGFTLHRVLVEAIEGLRPAPRVPRTAPAWRPYLALFLRYVEDIDATQVAQELDISPRQFRRERARGLKALTELLWARYIQQQSWPQQRPGSEAALREEIARLGTTASDAVTSIRPTVQGVISTLAELAARRRISVAAALPPDLPPVSVNRVALRQVLISTLTHALDLGTDGVVEMTACASDQQVELVITRRGGIASTGAALVGDDRLAIAAHLAEMQGGYLSVEPGSALRVHLMLPVRLPPTVLVVDDNPDVIQLFQRYLRAGLYNTVAATTGEEALRLAQQTRPYAITLDVMMPTQDGWEILQNLKAHPTTRHIPVIVCSVLRERELALSLGAADFLAKPITQEMLLMALARCRSEPADAERPGQP